tara:strand:- start:254 stop:457 length:204 start_codon:yes stop_codon:yes gene_type:complete
MPDRDKTDKLKSQHSRDVVEKMRTLPGVKSIEIFTEEEFRNLEFSDDQSPAFRRMMIRLRNTRKRSE